MSPRSDLRLLLGLSIALAACDDTRDVHVVGRTIRVLRNAPPDSDTFGTLNDYIDFRGLTTSAFMRADGGVDTFAGIGLFGAIVVLHVPDGQYLLTISDDSHFVLGVQSSASDLDISEIALGRPLLEVPTRTTNLSVSLTNLAPWVSGDELELFSVDTGIVLRSLERFATTGTPAAGASELRGFEVDFAKHAIPLIESEPWGDQMTMMQLSRREADTGLDYRAATRIFNADLVTMVNGRTATVTGAFGDIALAKSIPVRWNGPAFESRLAEVNPNAVLAGAAFEVRVLPRADELGAYEQRSPVLLTQELGAPVPDVRQTFTYGNPFPEVYDEIATYLYQIDVEVRAEGSTRAVLMRVGYSGEVAVSSLSGELVLEPKLSSVRAPLINGMNAFAPQSGVGLTPVISWTAPEVGTPNGYEVSVLRVFDSGGQTQLESVAHLVTQSTELAIPPTTFLPDQVYIARINAFDTASRDVQRAPFRVALPSHRSSVLTAVFRP